MSFGKKIKTLTPYEPLAYSGQIRLDANESYLNLPHKIKKQFIQLLQKTEYNRYPDPLAKELCKAFASCYGVKASDVVAGNGSDEIISILMGCLLNAGDKVLTVSPDFSMYNIYSGIYELTSYSYIKNDEYLIDADRLIEQAKGCLLYTSRCV